MCGRFPQTSSPQQYAELFGISTDLSARPRYNVAPSTNIIACRVSHDGDKELSLLHWGLIPSWSKGPDNRFSMINARAETVASKPAYRTPFRKRRCLIPADGFYEWTPEDGKQPYYIHDKDDKPLVFAGIWDHWQDDQGDRIDSCSIIVCDANQQMKNIHDRMPVILSADSWESWLTSEDKDALQALLVPYSGDLDIYKISRAVNSPKHDGPELLKPV
jgi:putative SOS response-associated peptidase YedK